MPSERARPALFIVIAAAILIAVAAFWLPRRWENREYNDAEKIAGVGSTVVPGKVTDARKRVDPGLSGARAIAALGKPSFAVRTEGASSHEIWKYYFADGTMTVNLTDGYIARISTEFGPPKIPQSHRH